MDQRDLWRYHPAGHVALIRFEAIREAARKLSDAIADHGGNEHDKNQAILKLREAVFYAIASIAIPEATNAIS